MPETDDIAAALRAWARRAKAIGQHDMRAALNAAATEVERLQDRIRALTAQIELGRKP